jgi:hypothetical protein
MRNYQICLTMPDGPGQQRHKITQLPRGFPSEFALGGIGEPPLEAEPKPLRLLFRQIRKRTEGEGKTSHQRLVANFERWIMPATQNFNFISSLSERSCLLNHARIMAKMTASENGNESGLGHGPFEFLPLVHAFL